MIYTINMNYRETQSKLVTDSYFLLLLFILCAAGMMLVSTIIFYYLYIFIYHAFESTYYDTMPGNIWYALAIFNLVIIMYMICAYRIRMTLLKSGGAKIAEYCGATEITKQNTDYYSKRFQDIVEELAIACSLPVPRTYILNNCNNINAFAAGYELEDAAITVTRGAMMQLNREELQAIIAHEFSHIVHKDVRLNMQLIAFNASINSFLEFSWVFDTSQYESPIDFIYLPLAPIVIIMMPFGAVGSVFSALLKLGVNRKREFLADASAIRYTRYAAGLLGALKKIGGIPADREFENSSLQFVSHMMFDNKSMASGLVASHPSLMARIQLYDPTFTNSKLLSLRNQYEQHLPDGKAEDRELGYCPDGENYVRHPDHVDAKMTNEKSADYMLQLQRIHDQPIPGEGLNRILMLAAITLIILLMIMAGKSLYHSITPASTLPPGIMVDADPEINFSNDIPGFTIGNFTISPIATFKMQARVLNVAKYKHDSLSAISPQELYLGWQNMSDTSTITNVKFVLADRSYGFRYYNNIDINDICSHTAYAIIIPASDEIAKVMSKISINNIIKLSGYVVNFNSTQNKAKSSSFCDTANRDYIQPYNEWNLWVDSVEIIK